MAHSFEIEGVRGDKVEDPVDAVDAVQREVEFFSEPEEEGHVDVQEWRRRPSKHFQNDAQRFHLGKFDQSNKFNPISLITSN